MNCVKYFLCCILVVILQVGSISNNPNDKVLITEQERRAAEKLENTTPSPFKTSNENKISESKKRGVFLSAIQRSPTSLIHPGLAIGYDQRESSYESSKYDRRPPLPPLDDHDRRPSLPPLDHDRRPYHYPPPSSDSHGGSYPGRYPSSSSYPGDYGHSSNGVYDHLGPVEYDYPPTGGYGHSSGVGSGYKSPFAFKGLLLPLAGIALLGAAAALSTNPVLLQLGTINKYGYGGRKKRGVLGYEIDQDVYPANHLVRPDEK